jgi:hypothetical protein
MEVLQSSQSAAIPVECNEKGSRKKVKIYNHRDSLVVIDPTTSAVQQAERYLYCNISL